MGKKDIKRFKLDYLLKLAAHIDGFSAYCPDCQLHRREITELLKIAENTEPVTKAGLKAYSKKMNAVTKHLEKTHKMVAEGMYIGLAGAIGPGIGVAIGVAVDNTAAGIGVGVALGTGIGWLLDRKAKKEGRMI
jgi:zinc transporter ZupT